MPRLARGLADGMVYHVINRGNGRQDVFHKDEDFQAFISLLREAREKFAVKLLGYCLMTNHFHLLLVPEKADDLSRFMQWLMTSHVRRYHCHYRTSGHVWQGRYKSFIIENDSHLLTVVRYIEGNPVRISLVPSADQWRWSSHPERLRKDEETFLDELPMPLPLNWTEYVNMPLAEGELERLRQSMNRGAPFGNYQWQRTICEKLELESTIRPKGRPRVRGQEK